jgi:hypothetical protein
VEDFIDRVLTDGQSAVEASSTELELTSLLAEYDTDELNAEHILKRTLGSYHRRQMLAAAPAGQIRSRLSTIKEEFLHQAGVPTWMNTAAMRAGVDFFRAWRMWSAYEQHGLIPAETTNALSVEDWLNVFFEVMALLPPRRVAAYLADETTKRPTVMKKLRDAVGTATDVDSLPWNIPPDWVSLWQELKSIVLLYMRGASYIDIATVLLGLSADKITNKRTKGDQPIPSVFSFLRKVVDGLAIDAGCFLSVHQFGVCGDGAVSAIPENLQALPLCIRNGCNSLTSLSWFRFGFRQRVCAHAFARAFNMPYEVTTDSERAEWVRQTRKQWLAGNIKAEHEPLLAHAMTVVREGAAI